MDRTATVLVSLLVLGVAFWFAGCSGQQGQSQPAADSPQGPAAAQSESAAPSEPAAEAGEHAGHEHGASAEQGGDALAELSEADRAVAEKQKVCPVSGKPLGSMGKPFKVTLEGRVVFLCCQGCEAELKKDPQKYLAKLPK